MEPELCEGWDWITLDDLLEDKRPLFYSLKDLVVGNKVTPFT